MLRAVVTSLCLVLSTTSAQELVDSYLPPPTAGTGDGDRACPPVGTSTRYTTSYQIDTRYRQVTREVPQYVTETAVTTRLVPSEIVSTSFYQSTIVLPQDVVRTSVLIQTITNTQTIPGAVRQVTRTSEQLVVSTRFQDVVNTVETTLVQPTTIVRTDFRTQVNTRTLQTPQVQVVTQTQPIPGPEITVTRTEEVINTRFFTQPSPPVVSTRVVQNVVTITSQVVLPGAVITSTQVVPSTQIIPVESVTQVPQVNTVQQTVARQFERTLYRTFTSEQVVPQTIVSTNVVNSQILETRNVAVTRTQVQFNTRFITQRIPAPAVTSTVFQTNVVTQTLPGRTVPVVRTQVVDQVVQREVVQTQVVPQVIQRVVYVTEKCGGYGGYPGGRGYRK